MVGCNEIQAELLLGLQDGREGGQGRRFQLHGAKDAKAPSQPLACGDRKAKK